jgi:hypothetical protein
MNNDSTEISHTNDELNFYDFFHKLLLQKKLIILVTLIFTISCAIFINLRPPSFKSNALIEIGQNSSNLLEDAQDLIDELKIVFFHTATYRTLSFMQPIEGKLIEISINSNSLEKNVNILSEVTDYIIKRHKEKSVIELEIKKNEIFRLESLIDFKKESEKLKINNKKLTINNEILLLENEIKFSKSNFNKKNETIRSDLINEISNIKKELLLIDNKIILLNILIQEDSENLNLLTTNPKILMQRAAINPTLNEKLFLYKEAVINHKYSKTILKTEIDKKNKEILNLEYKKDPFIFDLEQRLLTLVEELKKIDKDYGNEEIFKLSQQINSLKNSQLQNNESRLIGGIKSIKNDYKILFTFIGFILGFIFSIFIVLFKNSIYDQHLK